MKIRERLHHASTPATHRHASRLADAYGFRSYFHLMRDIPENGNVLDVGTGFSTFGAVIAQNRPDIQWTNVDIRYSNPTFMKAAKPIEKITNLGYVACDALDLTSQLQVGGYDRVFSYFMLPHLALYGGNKARVAAANMLWLLNEDGVMQVGPTPWQSGVVENVGKSIRVTAAEVQDAATLYQYADEIAAASQLPVVSRLSQQLTNSFYMLPNMIDPAYELKV